jgi:hypothetical protein
MGKIRAPKTTLHEGADDAAYERVQGRERIALIDVTSSAETLTAIFLKRAI